MQRTVNGLIPVSNPPKKSNPTVKRRRSASRATAIGAFVPKVARAAFETHGFPSANLLSDWPEIIGSEYAGITAPERLVWPRGEQPQPGEGKAVGYKSARRAGATLIMRVEGPRALEIQHIGPQLLERINIYFGYRAISELRLVQGPVRRQSVAVDKTPKDNEPETELNADIEDEGLRIALSRLGSRID